MSKRSRRIKREAKKQEAKQPFVRFRFHYKAGHPALIVSENGYIAEGMTISHKSENGKLYSYELTENPECLPIKTFGRLKRKPEASYLVIQLRKGVVGLDYGKEYLTLFQLNKADEGTAKKIIKAKKEGKPFSTYFTKEELKRIRPKKKK